MIGAEQAAMLRPALDRAVASAGPALRAGLRAAADKGEAGLDDKALADLATLLHAQLPFAVRMVVKAPMLAAFLGSNRDWLIAAARRAGAA